MNPLRLFGALLITLTVAACGSSGSSSSSGTGGTPASSASTSQSSTSSAAPAGPVIKGATTVAIDNYAYKPATITVAAGTKITFVNHDQTAHTATSTKPGFDSGTLQPGASHAITVTKAGTYAYYCQFHAFMKGTIVVR